MANYEYVTEGYLKHEWLSQCPFCGGDYERVYINIHRIERTGGKEWPEFDSVFLHDYACPVMIARRIKHKEAYPPKSKYDQAIDMLQKRFECSPGDKWPNGSSEIDLLDYWSRLQIQSATQTIKVLHKMKQDIEIEIDRLHYNVNYLKSKPYQKLGIVHIKAGHKEWHLQSVPNSASFLNDGDRVFIIGIDGDQAVVIGHVGGMGAYVPIQFIEVEHPECWQDFI